jgi:hypothetical protein
METIKTFCTRRVASSVSTAPSVRKVTADSMAWPLGKLAVNWCERVERSGLGRS